MQAQTQLRKEPAKLDQPPKSAGEMPHKKSIGRAES